MHFTFIQRHTTRKDFQRVQKFIELFGYHVERLKGADFPISVHYNMYFQQYNRYQRSKCIVKEMNNELPEDDNLVFYMTLAENINFI